jgi:hypothetical protein
LAKGPGQATVKVQADGKEAAVSLEVVAASTAQPAALWAATEPPNFLKGIAGQARTAGGTRLLWVRQAPSYGSALFYFSSALGAWVPLYPNLGGLDELSPDPASDTVLVARSATTLYRSTNGGIFWQPVASDPDLAQQPVQRTAANPQVLYAGRLRSKDGGATWSPLDCGLTAGFGLPVRYAFAPQNAERVYCYTGSEVSRSSNGGSTWQPITLPVAQMGIDAFGVDRNGALYLAGSSAGASKTYRSTNNAQSWSTGGDLSGPYSHFKFTDDNDNLYLYSGDTLAVSKDKGTSWTIPVFTGEFQPDFSEGSLQVDPNSPGILYTYQRSLLNPVLILRSADFGSTWQSTGVRTDVSSSAPVTFDGDTTYALGGEGLWASSDKGANFSRTNQNRGLTLFSSLAGWQDRSNPNRLLGTGFLGLTQSNNGGQNWGTFEAGLVTLAQAPGTPIVWYGAGGRGDVLVSSNEGRSWNWVGRVPLAQGEGNALKLAVSPGNTELVFAAGLGGVYRSSDGGATWVWASKGLERVLVSGDLLALSDQRLYVATREGIYTSGDGGAGWSPLNTGLRNLNITQLAQAADGTLFAGASDGGVYRALDGNTWEWVSDELTSYRIQDLATDPRDANVLYAATVGGIYKSINKGSNWLRASKGLTSPFVNWLNVSLDGQTLYLGTADQGVFKGQPGPAEGADFRTQSVR